MAAAVRTAAWNLVLLPLLSVLVSASSQTFPYLPSTILVPGPQNASHIADTAYILVPKGNAIDLLSLNITSSLQASSLDLQLLTSGAPFLDSRARTSTFTPSILANGTILVYAGDCSSSTTHTIWTYSPPTSDAAGTVLWTKHSTTGSLGPFFLGGSLSFSAQLAPTMSEPMIYAYGGMCPSLNQSATTWQTSATYSNQMLKISQNSDASYGAVPIGYRGPPIAEAGFTFTALTPSVSNRSGIITQQANNVLLGGHTQQAFINMSMAAVWSLPEENWSFVPISPPSSTNTELAIKKDVTNRALPTSVSSRSGHTAVLSEDGTALVVLGGWVGDVGEAADPQLAILEMGAGYGQWQWSIPTAQPSGRGIYGHGAALLPGNVMMVYGGYTIAPLSSKLKPRQAGAGGSNAMFLNLTSLSWSDSYTNPVYTGPSPSHNDGTASKNRTIGLGVGLGVGIPLLIAVIAAIIYYRTQRDKRQQDRDETVRALAQDHSQFLHNDEDEMLERDDSSFRSGWNPRIAGQWYTGGNDPYGAGGRSLGYESLRGSRSTPTIYNPPKGILRKPTRQAARGLYQPTTLADYESRAGQRGTGGIHPIQEADEEVDMAESRSISPDKDEESVSDPFLTPSGVRDKFNFPGSATPSPESNRARAQDREVQDWVSDVDVADAVLAAKAVGHHGAPGRHAAAVGRHSPTRRLSTRSKASSPTTASFYGDDEARTASNLSDRSAFSFIASRSGSVRSRLGRAQAVAVAAAKDEAAPRGGSSGGASSSEGSSAHSYNTARSSFPALQAEGPVLLLGGRAANRHGDSEDDDMLPGSPSKNKPRRSWFGPLGSLRRVFSSQGPGSSSSESSRADSPAGRSFEEPTLFGLRDCPNATYLRRQRGRSAWENTAATGVAQQQGQGQGQGRNSDDWDVEKASQGRQVQIMFTVPRGELRVVNAGAAEKEEQEEEIAVIVNPEGEEEEDGEMDIGEALHDMSPEELREYGEMDSKSRATPPSWLKRKEVALPKGGYEALDGEEIDRDQDEEEDEEKQSRWTESGRLMLVHDEDTDEAHWVKDPRAMTPSPNMHLLDGDDDGGSASSPILTAEAVRLKRPPTRVLEMVEQIEGGSRKGTPQSTPKGSPARRS